MLEGTFNVLNLKCKGGPFALQGAVFETLARNQHPTKQATKLLDCGKI